MTAANIDHTDLNNAQHGGVVHEDFLNRIFTLDSWPLPFTDMCAKDRSTNQTKSWAKDEIGTPNKNNATIDGANLDQQDASLGERVQNHHQTSVYMVQISKRAQNVRSVQGMGSVSDQLNMGQTRLRRDVEAQMLSHQASQPGDGVSTPGISGGIGSWLETNVDMGGGTAGGFNLTTGNTTAPTPGAARALSESAIKDVNQSIFKNGGRPDTLMMTPELTRLFSEYCYESTSKIAQLVNQDMGNGGQPNGGNRAWTAIGMYITDYGTNLTIWPNRNQLEDDTDESTAYLLDRRYLGQSFITGYQAEKQGLTGLNTKWQISVDYTFICKSEKGLGAVFACSHSTPVVP